MFRTLYGDRDESQKKGIAFTEPTMTDVSQADDCDINKIISNYNLTGILHSPGSHDRELLKYGDATLVNDLQTALGLVDQAHAEFADLPSETRRAFNDDPMELVNAFADPTKLSMLQDLGLAPKPQVQEPAAQAAQQPAAQAAQQPAAQAAQVTPAK